MDSAQFCGPAINRALCQWEPVRWNQAVRKGHAPGEHFGRLAVSRRRLRSGKPIRPTAYPHGRRGGLENIQHGEPCLMAIWAGGAMISKRGNAGDESLRTRQSRRGTSLSSAPKAPEGFQRSVGRPAYRRCAQILAPRIPAKATTAMTVVRIKPSSACGRPCLPSPRGRDPASVNGKLATLDLAFQGKVSRGKCHHPSAGRRSEFPAAQCVYKEAVGSLNEVKDLRLSINGGCRPEAESRAKKSQKNYLGVGLGTAAGHSSRGTHHQSALAESADAASEPSFFPREAAAGRPWI